MRGLLLALLASVGAAVSLGAATAPAAGLVVPAADSASREAAATRPARRLAVTAAAGPTAFVRFDLPAVDGRIERVLLRVYARTAGSRGLLVGLAANGWTGVGVRAGALPAAAGGDAVRSPRPHRGRWLTVDVTRLVATTGPLTLSLRTDGRRRVVLDGHRAGRTRPRLRVTVAPAVAAPPPAPAPAPPPPPPPPPDATLVAVGDIGGCSSSHDEEVAGLVARLVGEHPQATIATLGDTVYDAGTPTEFQNCFDPAWGRFKARIRPAAGNHDYATAGAAGYYGYFGAAAGDPSEGYYSYDLGAWHVVVLNSNCMPAGGCGAGSPQERWLRADLAAHPAACTLAYWHHPPFSSGPHGDDATVLPLVQALYEGDAELVLNGHDHTYERFAPVAPDGSRDAARGLRFFVVGTGGRSLYAFATPQRPTTEVRDDETYGALLLTLGPTGYRWSFERAAGGTFTDAGSGACH